MDVLTIHKKIEASAETVCDTEKRIIKGMKLGQVIRQGDIYLQKIKKVPEGKETQEKQLVAGTTKGSRHILAEDFVGRIIVPSNPDNELEGPTIEAKAPFTLTHPEHADFEIEAGIYKCTHQRDFLQEEIKRVRD